jgi:hypothetical protein
VRLAPEVLAFQRRMLAMLKPGHQAEDATAYFTDLRVITALLCMSWPSAKTS